MALPKVGDGQQMGDGNTNETLNVGRSGQPVVLQPSSTGLVGFFGAVATNQMASLTTTTLGALSTTVPVNLTSSQLTTLTNNQNAMILALKQLGLMAP